MTTQEQEIQNLLDLGEISQEQAAEKKSELISLQAKLKELEKKVRDAGTALMTSKPENLMDNFQKKVAAEKELQDFRESIISPEEIEAEKKFKDAEEIFNEAKEIFEAAREELAKFKPELKKKSPSTSNEGGSHAPSLNYEIAQKIRKDISEKLLSMKEIATKYGVTTSTVNCVRLYINWKLQKGDVEYTPLINNKFPAGAPYAKD